MNPDTPRRRDEPVMCGCETKTALPCQNDRMPGYAVCEVHAMDALRTCFEALRDAVRYLWDMVSDAMREIVESFQTVEVPPQPVPADTGANTLPVPYYQGGGHTDSEEEP